MRDLPKVKSRSKKRLGRGEGSGKGSHTVGRGVKGQKSRTSVHILFEGLKMKKSLIKRLPLQRGKGKNKPSKKPLVVNIEYLNTLPSGTRVDLDQLIKSGIVKESSALKYGVKILGDAKLETKLTVAVPTSKSAAKLIEKAGGEVVVDKKDNKKIDTKK